MRCEACGHSQPDPKPVVIETVKEVEVGDNALYKKFGLYIFIFVLTVAILISAESLMSQRTIQKALETPGVKVERTEYDGTGKPTLKIER